MKEKSHRMAGRTWTRQLGRVLSALLCTLGVLRAGPLDFTEAWSGGDLAGWQGGGGGAELTNDLGFLRMSFEEQAFPKPVVCLARFDLPAGAQVTNLSFRLLRGAISPSEARVYLRSASGREWYVPLAIPSEGGTQYDLPVTFGAGWTFGPLKSAALLAADMASVEWVGIYVLRDASARAQWVGLDDVHLQGAQNEGLSIAGEVAYGGEQVGTVRVSAESVTGSPTGATAVVLAPGSYSIDGLRSLTDYHVGAYLDSDGSGTRDFWEAWGDCAGSVRVGVSNVTGVAVTLADPAAQDGVPYWWLKRHFNIDDPQTSGDPLLGGVDSDGDGMVNYAEYRAGTDPTNAASRLEVFLEMNVGEPGAMLRWGAVNRRTYSVLSADRIDDGFSVRQGGIPAEGPTNAYRDSTATNAVRRFYKVIVE
jgi:hypothetical protein